MFYLIWISVRSQNLISKFLTLLILSPWWICEPNDQVQGREVRQNGPSYKYLFDFKIITIFLASETQPFQLPRPSVLKIHLYRLPQPGGGVALWCVSFIIFTFKIAFTHTFCFFVIFTTSNNQSSLLLSELVWFSPESSFFTLKIPNLQSSKNDRYSRHWCVGN